MTTPVLVDTASPVHHTATVDTAWDGAAAEKNLDSPMTVATAKAAYGWYDAGQVDAGEIVKAGCKLPHHQVSADGTPGAANLPGVRNALSRLPQSDIPAAEQDAVRKHLQAHLDDAPEDSAPGTSRPRLHVPRRLQDLVRPGASFKHDPPANRTIPQADRWRIVNHDPAAGGPAEVWLYDEIGFWGISAEMFCRALAELDAPEILLRVNSPGGDVFDGTAMYNALIDHPATVTCRVEGLAASAASFIAQAADRVVMGRGAEMMIHDASGLCIGNAADMLETAAILDRVSDGIAGIYHDRAGGGQKSWRDTMRGEQWYTADEAVAAGLADEVAAAPKKRGQDDTAAAARADGRVAAGWDLSLFRYPGRDAAPAPAAAGRERVVASAAPQPAPTCGGAIAPAALPVDLPETHINTDLAAESDPPAAAEPPSEPGGEGGTPTATTEPAGEPAPDTAPTADPEPAAEPEPAAAQVAAAFPGSRPGAASGEPATAGPEPDPWAAAVAHLMTEPPAPSVDVLLAHLRGDTA